MDVERGPMGVGSGDEYGQRGCDQHGRRDRFLDEDWHEGHRTREQEGSRAKRRT